VLFTFMGFVGGVTEHTYHLPEHTELDETGFESEPEGAS
jgi:hypothetical protein